MTWLTVPTWLVVFTLVMVTFYPLLASSSRVSYADHCGSTVPSSTPTSILFVNPANRIPLSTGFFSDGDDLLNADPDPSSPSLHGSFSFFVQNYYLTRTPGIIKLDASMSFIGQNVRFTRRKELYFQLSGFWSKNSGQVCLVGSASNGEGNVHILYAVFKLNYPQSSDISTSLVSGTFESLDVPDSTYHFDPVSILAYIQHNYSYTKIPQAADTCIRDNVPEESLGVDHCTACNDIKHMLGSGRFELDHGRGSCNDGYCGPSGFPAIFMNLNQIQCTENGKVHMHIAFSNNTYAGFDLFPHTSLISEGFWDSDESRLCMVACPITKDFAVSDCTVGLSLWFPAVLSITSRSTVVGRMWSKKDEIAPDYFSTTYFRGTNNAILPGIRYEYTRTDSARGYCKNEDISNVGDISYTDGDFIDDLSFDLSVKISEGNTVPGYATPLSLGETFHGSSYRESPVDLVLDTTLEETSSSLRNVSYRISYSFYDKLLQMTTFRDISAEGVYDARTGTLFLIGCRDPCSSDLARKLKYDCSLDCEILITIQLSPLNSKDGRSRSSLINGTIQSTRETSHPLYFEPLEVSTYTYEQAEQQRAAQWIWKMDTDMIVVVASLALSCISVQMQMSYVKKRPEVLPSISMMMLLELTVGHLLPLVLNFEAPFSGKRTKEDIELGSEWLEANGITLRAMIMSAFILQLRLLQWAANARSLDKDRKSLWDAERTVARFCLLRIFWGPLTSLFGSISSYVTQSKRPLIVAEYNPHAGLVLLGHFLIPQILLNFVRSSTDKSLSLAFCIGVAVARALPRLYYAYRAGYFAPYIGSSSMSSASAFDTFYFSSRDTGIPLQEVMFVVLVLFQQQFGGRFFLPKRFRKLHRS